MTKKNKQTATYLLIGLGVYLLMQKQTANVPVYTQFPQAPPAPPQSNVSSFAAWASAMLQIYGNTVALWQPGGPFYQYPADEINDILNTNPVPDYSNPYLDNYGGWV